MESDIFFFEILQVDDKREFSALQESLLECGISVVEADNIWQLLSTFLQLGDLIVEPSASAPSSSTASSGSEGGAGGPCGEYKLDTSASFNTCKCGHPKAAHTVQRASGGATGEKMVLRCRSSS